MNPYDILITPADRAACGEGQALPTAARPQPPMAPCGMPSLAMVYAKLQPFTRTYAPEEALARGTLFADLDLPFTAGGRK